MAWMIFSYGAAMIGLTTIGALSSFYVAKVFNGVCLHEYDPDMPPVRSGPLVNKLGGLPYGYYETRRCTKCSNIKDFRVDK